MGVTRRSRVIAAAPDSIWAVVSDPEQLPRWWPRVTRVEAVDGDFFTTVMKTDRGRAVRADQRVVVRERPTIRWAQDVQDTPFERLLRSASTAVTVGDGDAASATVTVELDRRTRGMARFGGLLFRRAGARQLDEALDGLERIVG